MPKTTKKLSAAKFGNRATESPKPLVIKLTVKT